MCLLCGLGAIRFALKTLCFTPIKLKKLQFTEAGIDRYRRLINKRISPDKEIILKTSKEIRLTKKNCWY
ncbi:hypothetical protein KHA80_02905 [Anaerobacillus sp. HL2]|nr:hypothetical protein KHA80_02905 [Anaerobacillus sp. HL2]